jgi:hypothetical protein
MYCAAQVQLMGQTPAGSVTLRALASDQATGTVLIRWQLHPYFLSWVA